MANCIYVGDEGTTFRVQLLDCDTGSVLPVDAASVKEIIFEDPLGTVTRYAAVFTTDGTDGLIEYVVIIGDLDMSGTWTIQGYVEGTGFKNSSSISTFEVSDILA